MGKRDICYVRGCHSRRYKNQPGVSYHRLPKQPESRRNDWIDFTKRKSEVKKCWKICSKHFVSGKPSKKAGDVDYIPTLNKPKKKKKQKVIGDIRSEDIEMKPVVLVMAEEGRLEDNRETLDDVKRECLDPESGMNQDTNDNGSSTDKGNDCRMVIKSEPLDDDDAAAAGQQVKNSPKPGAKESGDVEESDEDTESDDDSIASYESVDEEKEERKRTQGLCTVCGKDYRKPCRLREHMKSHANGKRRRSEPATHLSCVCPICGRLFKRHHELNYHILRIHEEIVDEEAICKVCDKVLANKSSVARHMKSVHVDSKDFACVECGKSFATAIAVKKHMSVHSDERPFVCSSCGDSFRHLKTLNRHEFTIHGNLNAGPYKTYICHICNAHFIDGVRLNSHMSIHFGKIHKCQYCDRTFSHVANMKNHIRGVHENDIRYQCTYCERRFGNSYNLKVHIRTHTGERPYHCNNCSKGFADVCNFRRHEVKCSSKPNVNEEMLEEIYE